MRPRRAAVLLLGALGVGALFLRGPRGERASTQPESARPGAATAAVGDPLDRLAAEVETHSDAADVTSVVEDLLTEADEHEEHRPG